MTPDVCERRHTGKYANMYIGVAVFIPFHFNVDCFFHSWGTIFSKQDAEFYKTPFYCLLQELCLSVRIAVAASRPLYTLRMCVCVCFCWSERVWKNTCYVRARTPWSFQRCPLLKEFPTRLMKQVVRGMLWRWATVVLDDGFLCLWNGILCWELYFIVGKFCLCTEVEGCWVGWINCTEWWCGWWDGLCCWCWWIVHLLPVHSGFSVSPSLSYFLFFRLVQC